MRKFLYFFWKHNKCIWCIMFRIIKIMMSVSWVVMGVGLLIAIIAISASS